MATIPIVPVVFMAFLEKKANISLVGSCEAMGFWEPKKSVKLEEEPSDSGIYVANLQLASGVDYEFKLISSEDGNVNWEPSPYKNHLIRVTSGQSGPLLVEVHWAGSSNIQPPKPIPVPKDTRYKLTVYTGDKRGAGTDSKVYVILSGENGPSQEMGLHHKTGKDKFEQGEHDEFDIECADLGKLKTLKVRHDNTGSFPGWFLDKIIVVDNKLGITYDFPCNKWLAKDEGDKQISRDLLVASETEIKTATRGGRTTRTKHTIRMTYDTRGTLVGRREETEKVSHYEEKRYV